MQQSELVKYITKWNIKHPFDKTWRVKHGIALFSSEHRQMCLVDILMEIEEDKLYDEAYKEVARKKEQAELYGVTAPRDLDYIPGAGNWLSAAEDSMSLEDADALFDKIKF